MNITNILKNKTNLLYGAVILGLGYVIYKTFVKPKGKWYPMGYITQGRFKGKDVPSATAIHFGSPRPKEIDVAPDGKGIRTNNYVKVSGTGVFDGVHKVIGKWNDTNRNLGAVWVSIDTKLGNKGDKITEFIGKSKLQVID
tara:strand:- start:625 stop:1047 length:423 start_codon:yes stop_codon:yes gene_type:complete